MSLIETERLLRSRVYAKQESTDFAVFFYNYKFSEADFKSLFKSAQYLGVAWLPGWTWHINQNGQPNIRHPFINHKIPPSALPTDRRTPTPHRKLPPSRSIGTYGYVTTMSAADQSRLVELYGLFYIKTVEKVVCTTNNPLSPKQILSAMVYFDPWHTADFGKSILNEAWQKGWHNLQMYGAHQIYLTSIIRHIMGQPSDVEPVLLPDNPLIQQRITGTQPNGLGSGSHTEVAMIPRYQGQRNPQQCLSKRRAQSRGILEASNIPGNFVKPQQLQATAAINNSRRATDAQKENTKMLKQPSLYRFPSILQRSQPSNFNHPQQAPPRSLQGRPLDGRAGRAIVIPGSRRPSISSGAATSSILNTNPYTISRDTPPILSPGNGMAPSTTPKRRLAGVTQQNQLLDGLSQSGHLLLNQGQDDGRIVTPTKQSVSTSNIVSPTISGGLHARTMQPTESKSSQRSPTKESGNMPPPVTPSRRHSIGQPSSSHSQASTVSEGSPTPSKRLKFVRKSGTRAEAEKNGKSTPRKVIVDMNQNPQRRAAKLD